MANSYRGMFREGEFDRPFSVSVVPPSGRRPWPILTAADDRRDVEGQPVTVHFTYPVHYVPAGKRNPGINWVRDREAVLFRTAEQSQLRTACVIRREGSDQDITEVIHFEGELWWSLPGRPTINQFAAALTAGEHAAVGLIDQGCVTTRKPASSEQELAIKELIWNGHDDRVGRLGRGAAGILVSNGKVFVRDGAPLQVLWNGYRNQSITSIGISEVVVELASSRRNPAFEDASNELIFGRPFEAGDRAGIATFATEKGITFAEDAKIEILLPELLRQDPLKVQLAATLCKLSRLLCIRRPGTEDGSDEIALELRCLRDGIERDGLASERAHALKRFEDWAGGPEVWKKKLRVERLLAPRIAIGPNTAGGGLPSPFSELRFSEEDEAAIDRHFGSPP